MGWARSVPRLTRSIGEEEPMWVRGSPLQPTGESGERCKLPRSGQNPGQKQILLHFIKQLRYFNMPTILQYNNLLIRPNRKASLLFAFVSAKFLCGLSALWPTIKFSDGLLCPLCVGIYTKLIC